MFVSAVRATVLTSVIAAISGPTPIFGCAQNGWFGGTDCCRNTSRVAPARCSKSSVDQVGIDDVLSARQADEEFSAPQLLQPIPANDAIGVGGEGGRAG
jgi:hypothetical protein